MPCRRSRESTVTNAQPAPSVVVEMFSPATPVAPTAPSTSATRSTIRPRSGRVRRLCRTPAGEITRVSSASSNSRAIASASASVVSRISMERPYRVSV